MDQIAVFIGYSVILLASLAAASFLLVTVAGYALKQFSIFWRISFIIGRWKRINYLMEHLPERYWEDHVHWRQFRMRDFRVPVNK